jgi:hypothetical protein
MMDRHSERPVLSLPKESEESLSGFLLEGDRQIPSEASFSPRKAGICRHLYLRHKCRCPRRANEEQSAPE